MKNTFRFTLALLAGIATLAFTGCGGDGGSDPAGPSGAGAFAGASMSFNPTVNFLAGNAMTYINTEAGSPFPAAAIATAGTYAYVPNANFTSGTLTLTITGVADPVVLQIANFVRSGPNVTGFTARVAGQNYPVTVTGTIEAYQKPASGGGGAGESRADDIPSSMQGSHELTFHKSETAAIAGVPADGTVTTFVIGARTLAFNGRTLTNPVFYAGNQLEWIFKDGSIWWAVSKAVDGGLNEINVQGPYTGTGNSFYGQYNDRVPGDNVTVDVDGKFVPDSYFDALVNSTNEGASGTVYNQTPKLTGTVNFSINSAASLSFGIPTDFGGFVSYTFPFVSATSTTVTYRFQEAGNGGTVANKDYTAVVTKNGSGKPTELTITFIQTNGSARTTTHTYGLIVQN